MNEYFNKNMNELNRIAHYHLPGLFEFYEFYKVFLELFYKNREYFYEWCDIGSIYGSPEGCIWGGGRTSIGCEKPENVKSLMEEYGISARLTFSNSLLQKEHLKDLYCNQVCKKFEDSATAQNGIIIYSELLLDYISQKFPKYYFVSTTTKVLVDFNDFINETNRNEFKYVVPDFRLNKKINELSAMKQFQKDKTEFLCNECCPPSCKDRKSCYENVSKKNLGINCADFECKALNSSEGYRFSKAIENPCFISVEEIRNKYLNLGFSNFKIEGRGLGSAVVLEMLLYYMTKPEYQLKVREAVYLDSMLDLF